jgi:hypothetical protein
MSEKTDWIDQSEVLMLEFAARTGLTTENKPTRYLWTDAFAVCNFLGLARVTKKKEYLKLALRLIDQVHETLGRHRKDDPRTGWISGLDEKEGRKHPTLGGLRIGKKMPERREDESFNHNLEWERDGQYFHYLTKWMHALDCTARQTGEKKYAAWSLELAHTAREAFVYPTPSGSIGMYWKMSIDLSRPLVPSMGQHDPLDGYVTLRQLQGTAAAMSIKQNQAGLVKNLTEDLEVFSTMTQDGNWGTTDPLGLGGLLMDSVRLRQIQPQKPKDRELLDHMLQPAQSGIRAWAESGYLEQPPSQRLAFRELGLAIGLHALEWRDKNQNGLPDNGEKHSSFYSLGKKIAELWLDPDIRVVSIWQEHEDINAVMLAAALHPQGFVELTI